MPQDTKNLPKLSSGTPQKPVPTPSGGCKKTFSFRLEPGLYARLDSWRREKGLSFADIMRELLGAVESRDKETFDRGYMQAVEEFGVKVPCYLCYEPFYVRDKDLKREIADFVVGLRKWCHADCDRSARLG